MKKIDKKLLKQPLCTENLDKIKTLLDQGANINATDKEVEICGRYIVIIISLLTL